MPNLKIAHLVNYAPGLSGMYGTVRDLYFAEQRLGAEVGIIDDAAAESFFGGYGKDGVFPKPAAFADDADVIGWHHAMYDDWLNEPHKNLVMFLHGTPEYNLMTELTSKDKCLSLTIGASMTKAAKAFVTMWRRHLPLWESLLRTKVHYVPAWTDVKLYQPSRLEPSGGRIRIGLLDYWRLSREPFGLFMAIDHLRRRSGKKIEVDVWGLNEMPNKTWQAVFQWLLEDGVITLKGNADNPVEQVYHKVDLVLSMSSEETRVVREAYSCGVPVVCGHSGMDFTEFGHESVCPDRLAAEIDRCHERLCLDPAGLRRQLRAHAEACFDVDEAAKKVLEVFEGVVQEHGSVNRPKFRMGRRRMVASVRRTAEEIRKRMLSGRPVCHIRFGDGEILLMGGHQGWGSGTACPVSNSPEFRSELIESFKCRGSGYLVGCSAGQENEGKMRPGLFARHEVDDSLREVVLELGGGRRVYHNAVSLAYLSVFDRPWFTDFLETCVRNKRVALLCNSQVAGSPLVRQVLNVKEFVIVPAEEAYGKIGSIMDGVHRVAGSCDVILSAAGPVSNIIGHRLWKEGWRKAFVDIGSVADGLAGMTSRGWLRLLRGEYAKDYAVLFSHAARADIIVLTRGKPELTKRCFESVIRNTENPYRLIWIDNGSSDQEVQEVMPVADRIPECELVRNSENLGFSKAANLGLLRSLSTGGASHVVLLNNDVVVTPGWLGRLVSAMELGGYAAVGPLTSEDNPHSLEALGPVVESPAVKLEPLPKFGAEPPDERAKVLWEKYRRNVLKVDNMISFFCCVIRKDAVRQVGRLDEALFAYGEDNDFFRRLSLKGLTMGIALGAYVHHDHHATSKEFGEKWIVEQKQKAIKYLEDKYQDVKAGDEVGPKW